MTDYLRLAQERASQSVEQDENPYLPLARQQQELQQNRARTVIETALKDNPDVAAERLRLSQTSGLPPDVVRRNLEELRIKEQARAVDLVKMAQESPVLYRQLTDATFATTSVDDLDTLKNLERALVRGVKYIDPRNEKGLLSDAGGLTVDVGLAATAGVGEMLFNVAGTLNDMIGWQSGAQAARAQANRSRQARDFFGFQPESSTGQAVKSGVQSAGTNLALLPLGLARAAYSTSAQAGSVVAGAMATGVGADAYLRAREQGLTQGEALKYAIPEAGFEYLFEKIPASKLFGDIAANTGLLKTLGKQAVTEGWTEQVTTIAQDFNEWMNLNPDKTLGQFIQERPEAAYQTFVATLVGVGVQTTTIKGINKIIERASNESLVFEQDLLQQQMQLASQSALRARSPEQFRAHVQRVVDSDDGTKKEVYVDAEVLNQLPQELLAQLPESVREALPDALDSNSTVAIPMADVLTVAPGTELEQILNDNARMRPNAASRVEAQMAAEFLAQDAQRVLEQAQDQTAWQQSAAAVQQTILDQLNATGRFTPDVNEAYALLQGNFFSSMAARLGITPQELYDRYSLKVSAKQPGGRDLILDQITPKQAMATNVPVEMPADALFAEAVGNTQGAQITENGLLIDLVRFQKPEQEGGRAIRTGVFYLPSGASQIRGYKGSNKLYGGSEKFEGQTLIRRPMFVKGATGGKAPEAAFDQLKGKGAYEAMRQDVLRAARSYAEPQAEKVKRVAAVLEKYGASTDMAAEIVRNSREGNLLPYAVQENIVAHAVRGAGYDAVVGYSKGKAGPSISEVFDVREQTFPARGMESDVHEAFEQSATLRRGTETLKKYGLKPGKKYKTREVAAALEARQRAKYGTIGAEDRSPEALANIAKWMVAEVEFEMDNPEKSGVGWYSEKFQRALDVMGDVFPELKTDKTARNTMTALIAITSDGQKVVPNFAQAMDIYGNFRPGGATAGKFTTSRGHARQASIAGNLEVIQRLHDQMGAEVMHQYLMQEKTISELKKLAKANGGELKSDYQAHIKMPMAAVEFGPKLGAFYANLMGAHGYLTMDRWWSRTFNRYRGTLLQSNTQSALDAFKALVGEPELTNDEVLAAVVAPREALEARGFKTRLAVLVGKSEPGKAKEKAAWMAKARELAGEQFDALLSEHNIERAANTIYKTAFENLEDSPFNATDRTFMLDAVNKAQQTLKRKGYNLSVADIQAILWYYEKRLYGELGARQTADISYEEAAQRVAAGYASGQGIESLLDDAGAAPEDGGTDEDRVSVGEDDFVEGSGGVLNQSAQLPATIEVDGKTRPTTNSNGQPLAQTEEGVRNFWAWFGDSKVVDAEGKPLVMYHGTTADFDTFKDNQRGVHFVSPSGEWVEKFTITSQGGSAEGANVMPVYVRAENPFDFENKKHVSVVAASASLGKVAIDQIKVGSWSRIEDRTTLATIKKRFDGLYVMEDGQKNLAIFDPTQIKSATGNRGTFDPADPNILNQGPRGTFSPEQLLVTLNENADLSTFLHESGHFFLEVLADLAGQPNAPQQIVDDMAATLKWFGVPDLATWNGYTLEQKREHHEKWAESFEQYLFEGKAPNPELQPLFRRFRSWLINVYKSLQQFMRGRDLQLGDDIRRVFDRMIATDEQIAQAEEAAGMLPDFEATNEAIEALQARSLRDLKWTVNARNKYIKKLQTDAKELRKGIEAEVRAEVDATPEMQAKAALDALRKSTPESKAALADWKAQRQAALDKAAEDIKAQLLATEGAGLEGLKKGQFLSKNKRRIANEAEAAALAWERSNPKPERTMTGTDLEIATVADSFGYASVDEMLQAIDAFGPKEAAIEGMTDQRMLERHGDLVDARAIEEAANEAVHNEARARSLATELKAQSEMMSQRQDTGRTDARGRPITVNSIAQAAKEFALNLAARRRIKDLKSAAWQHRSAEARAGKAWQAATAKGETEAAVQAKRDQVLNNAAAAALQDAQAEVKKALEFFKRVTKGSDEKTVERGRDPDVVNAMRAILAAYGVAPRLEKSALAYMEVVAKNDPAMHGALSPAVNAAMLDAKPLQEMTVEELRGLTDTLRAMWNLAKRSRQMEVDGNLLDLEDAADELMARMDDIGIPDQVPGEKGAITDKEERGLKLQFAKSILRRVEQWAEGMDGKFGGPFLRLVFQPIKEAADRYRAARVDYRKRYTDMVKNLAPLMPPGAIDAPELGYKFGNARDSGTAELLHAILHTGNDSNKRKLLLGRGWASENADGTLDTSRWDAFIQRVIGEGKLRKEHYDFAQGVWDLLEETKPLAQKAHREVFGRYFAEVTANEFTTPFGTYRGGYVPAQTDSRLVKDAKLRELAEGENESMAYAFPAAPSGFTKARVDYNKPLLLDLRTLGQHIDKVLLFGHMQPAITDVRRLLTDKRVSYALDRIDPGAYEGMLIPWLNRSAKQIVETPVVGDRKLSRFLSAARSRAGMALMFANLSNTAQQITGFSLAAVKVKPTLMLKAMAQFTAGPKDFKKSVADASPYMKDRMLNDMSAMNDAVEEILVDPSLLERGQAWTQRHAYFLQSAADNVMSPIIWTAAYNQAIGEGQNAKDAVRFADGVVRQTQGSLLPEDVSRFETGPAYARLFTQFVSYFNMMANTNATAVKQITEEMGLRKGAGKLLFVAMAGLLAPIWVAEAIAQAFRGGPEDDEGDGYLDDWLAAVFGFGTIKGLTAQVPIVGQGAQLVLNRFNDKPADDKFSLSPAVSLIESSVGAPSSVYKAIMEEGSAQKAVRDTAAAATLLTGLPIYAAARPIGYAAGMADDRIEPTGPIDLTRGLVTGTASPQSKQP